MTAVNINWFEIPTNDLARARSFYENLLQIQMGEMPGPDGPMTIFMNGEQPVGTLDTSGQTKNTTEGVLIYLHTDDVAAALSRAAASGGSVVLPATSIGDHGTIGHFIDSEGNRMALHSP